MGNFWLKTTKEDEDEDEDEEIGENEYHFQTLHNKVRLQFTFNTDLRKDVLTHFWLFKPKIQVSTKKFGKTSTIFELSTLELGYIPIFIKI